jgi:ELWxxDGT repeat protein
VSDGTAQGTRKVKEISPDDSSDPHHLTPFGATILFVAKDTNESNYELYRSDGSEEGTYLVKELNPSGTSSLAAFSVRAGLVYFWANDGTYRGELWRTDGTAEGTIRLTSFNPEVAGVGYYAFLGSIALFGARPVGENYQLWKLSLASGQVGLVKNVVDYGGLYPQGPGRPVVSGNLAFFGVSDGMHGVELWCTDGTEAGTVLVKDIDPRSPSLFQGHGFVASADYIVPSIAGLAWIPMGEV